MCLIFRKIRHPFPAWSILLRQISLTIPVWSILLRQKLSSFGYFISFLSSLKNSLILHPCHPKLSVYINAPSVRKVPWRYLKFFEHLTKINSPDKTCEWFAWSQYILLLLLWKSFSSSWHVEALNLGRGSIDTLLVYVISM